MFHPIQTCGNPENFRSFSNLPHSVNATTSGVSGEKIFASMSESTIKLLSRMVTHRAVVGDPKRRQSGLLELPNELLLPILKSLSDNDLLSLIFLCRRLHLLVVPIYLTRIEAIDNPTHLATDNITVRGSKFGAVICLLQRSLCIASVKHLTCEFPGSDADVITDVRQVCHYVSRLSSVNGVSLIFARHYGRQHAGLAEWGTTFGELLRTLSNKFCVTITIRHGDQPAQSFVSSGPNPLTTTKGGFVPRPLVAVKDWLKPRISESDSLSRPSGFADALLPIRALSGSRITTLSLEFTGPGVRAWALILSHLTLPTLSEMRITCCTIPLGDLANFLSRHSLITTLDLSWVFPPCSRIATMRHPPKSILPNLKSLSATLPVVSFFSTCRFARLESISVPLTFIFTKHMSQMAEIDSTLQGFAGRKISWNLLISFDFDANDSELTEAADLLVPNEDRSRWQCLVKSVALNTNVQHPSLTEGAMRFLSPWLGHYFTAVEEVSVGYNCLCYECSYHRISLGSAHTLTQMIRSACPQVKVVTINGMPFA